MSLTSAEQARAWAREHRRVVDDHFDPHAVPAPLHPYSDDGRVNAVVTTLATRAAAMADDGELAAHTLNRIWTERLDTGFCSTEIHRVGDQFAILVDSGLIAALDVGSVAVARHYGQSFDVSAVTDEVRAGFGRFFTIFVAQYFLYGRIRFGPPPLIGFEAGVAARIAHESLVFVLGHELAHAMAGTRHFHGDHLWTDTEDVPNGLRRYTPEIEADAVALQMCFGTLWAGQPLSQAEVELRLFAVRMSFAILQTIEKCCLTPTFARHLPAERRWNGVLQFLNSRLPQWLMDKHNQDWNTLGPLFDFAPLQSAAPPEDSLTRRLVDTGWVSEVNDLTVWEEMEIPARQFRLATPVLHALLGLLADALDHGDPHCTVLQSEADAHAAVAKGVAITEALVDRLPAWLKPVPEAATTTSVGDIIEYLRKHQRWPEPFSAHPDVAPPIHLAAASIARTLRQS